MQRYSIIIGETIEIYIERNYVHCFYDTCKSLLIYYARPNSDKRQLKSLANLVAHGDMQPRVYIAVYKQLVHMRRW